ncbi:MAG TPA: helix-turn-helix domain-containing protein [Mycobacterium sp.]
MGMPQLVVTAVLVEGRSKSEVAREYGVSRRWVITLVQRYLGGGDQGLPRFEPRRRRARVRGPWHPGHRHRGVGRGGSRDGTHGGTRPVGPEGC